MIFSTPSMVQNQNEVIHSESACHHGNFLTSSSSFDAKSKRDEEADLLAYEDVAHDRLGAALEDV